MPWVTIEGERKKVACGPCIRGHRSSKCDHNDRVLLEVRKPGRPLSSCPHPSGSCNCQRVVINYTIPRASECACPSTETKDETPTAIATASSIPNGNRVQKNRHRKSTSVHISAQSIERALKSTEASDAASQPSSISTHASQFSRSESLSSNAPSPVSSNSSTPHVTIDANPSPQGWNAVPKVEDTEEALGPDQIPLANGANTGMKRKTCCGPKVTQDPPPVQALPQSRAGGCCGTTTAAATTTSSNEGSRQGSCCSKKPSQDSGLENNAAAVATTTSPLQQQLPNFPNGIPSFQMPMGMPYFGTNGAFHPTNQPFPGAYPHPGHMAGNMPIQALYGYNVPYLGGGFVPSPHQPIPGFPGAHCASGSNGSAHGSMDHNCSCGDSCACFGCAAHPQNFTTVNYVRTMAQYMQQCPPDGSTLSPFPQATPTAQYPFMVPHQQGFMYPPANQNMTYNGIQPHQQHVSMPFPYYVDASQQMHAPQSTLQIHTTMPNMPPSQVATVPTPTTEISQMDLRDTSSPIHAHVGSQQQLTEAEQVQSPESPESDIQTLSPSSFYLQSLVIPGCNDATGTCQCGDGCECVGCLTHGGHDGVPLDSTTATQGSASYDFLAAGHDIPSSSIQNTTVINGHGFVSPVSSGPT